MKKQNYYYLCPDDPEEIQGILTEGIFENSEGGIYLFENKPICDKITGAINTNADCFAQSRNLPSYAMFEINDSGIVGNLYPDTKHRILLKQPHIDPHFIGLFGTYRNEYSQLRSSNKNRTHTGTTVKEKQSNYFSNIHLN